MCQSAGISQFHERLCRFLAEWAQPLDERCKDDADAQVQAAYYMWARYTISIRALVHLCIPEFAPDMFVIARCCLEYKAALKAILSDAAIAGQYLEFEKHALASYKNYLEATGQMEKVDEVCIKLEKMGVADPDNHRATRWCKNGYTKLIREHGGPSDEKAYRLLCDFAHGSIVSLRFLQTQTPLTSMVSKMHEMTCGAYVVAAKAFFDRICGTITTFDGERCQKAFIQVAKCLC